MSGTGTDPDIAAAFTREFGYAPEGVWAAPGRINLIGEHTDYNEGFALPFALPHALSAALARRDDGLLRLRSRQDTSGIDTRVEELRPGQDSNWSRYPAGVVWTLRDQGHPVHGADLLVDSTIPLGAGLSSSAALTCAVAMAMAHLHGIEVDVTGIARLAHRAENEFVGMPCGLMDQSVVLGAHDKHLLFVDARSLATDQVPFDLSRDQLSLLVIDTRAPHRLVDGAYAARRASCERAAAILGVSALRDLHCDQLEWVRRRLPDDETWRRVRHVVTENERVAATVRLLREQRPREVGPLLTASHTSLRADYEVSVPEVDTAVEAAVAAGALGARITGGGFGGCVIALVDTEHVNTCVQAVGEAFHRQGYTAPTTFTATPAPGARHVWARATFSV